MGYIEKANEIVQQVLKLADEERKLTGFCIGNTAKLESSGVYFTPIRKTPIMVVAGVIVYSEKQAIDIAKALDGKVQYILVDAEKKISPETSLSGDPANVERAVRESLRYSTLWIYKGNDVSVDAVDTLLTQLTKNSVRGIGGKKITILGSGNLGTKLALKLVERGAHLTITRRKKRELETIVAALNYIKPANTLSKVVGTTINEAASVGAEILIGTTQGIPVITPEIVTSLANKAIIIDVGKGTLYYEAITVAEEDGIEIYRLDISAAFEGLIYKLWATENIVEKKLGRKQCHNEALVSGGLLGRKNEMVVDSVWNPMEVYGIADGKGDFIRNLSEDQVRRIEALQQQIKTKKW